MNKPLLSLFAAGSLVAAVGQANSQVLFSSLQNRGGDSTNYYATTNNGLTGASARTEFHTGNPGGSGVPVTFTFNVPVVPFGTNSIQSIAYIDAFTTNACTITGGVLNESLGAGDVTVKVAATDPTYGAQYGGQTLMVAHFTNAGLTQDQNVGAANPNPTFGASDTVPNPNVVTITSPFISTTSPNRISFSFAAGGNLACASNGTIATATFGGNGNFSANAARATVPEPGNIAMLLGSGVTGSLFLLRRKRN